MTLRLPNLWPFFLVFFLLIQYLYDIYMCQWFFLPSFPCSNPSTPFCGGLQKPICEDFLGTLGFQTPNTWGGVMTGPPKTYHPKKTVHLRRYDWKTRVWFRWDGQLLKTASHGRAVVCLQNQKPGSCLGGRYVKSILTSSICSAVGQVLNLEIWMFWIWWFFLGIFFFKWES